MAQKEKHMTKSFLQMLLQHLLATEWVEGMPRGHRYCPNCNPHPDRWNDQKEHHQGCEWKYMVAGLKSEIATLELKERFEQIYD